MLINSKKMLDDARLDGYAVPHFNINNLEWTRYILEVCNELGRPVILGVSEGALKYMGGAHVVSDMVKALIIDLNIKIDVALHLDHGKNFDICKEVIDAGFTSVMIDGSTLNIQDNILVTNMVCEYAKKYDVTVEAEIGKIGGTEDDISASNFNAKLEDVLELVNNTSISSIAPAVGSVHGLYKGEPNLDFELMREISDNVNIPLVLHGGTGISDELIKKAISCGISKININTELQVAWAEGVRKFLSSNTTEYDPRKIIGSGKDAIKKVVKDKLKLFFNIQ